MPKFVIMMSDGPEIAITDQIKKSSSEGDVKDAVAAGFKKALKEKKK